MHISDFYLYFNVQFSYMLDEKGSFYIVDTILAVILILIVFLIVNTALTVQMSDYSYESHNIRSAQDVMELLSGKIDFSDQTFLSRISNKLDDGQLSKDSLREVSRISKEKLNSYGLNNYRFCENEVLGGEVLASSGDFKKAVNVSSASRDYGQYSYSLLVW